MSILGLPRYDSGRRFRLLGLMAVFIGVIVLILTVYQYWGIFSFLAGTVSTTGTVVDCQINTYSSNCIPIIHFKTQTGQIITIRPDEKDSTSHIGDIVAVWYHPGNPEDGRIDVGIPSILKLLLLPLAALGLLLLGLLGLWAGGVIDLPGMIKKRQLARAEASQNKISRLKSESKSSSISTQQQQSKRKKANKRRKRR